MLIEKATTTDIPALSDLLAVLFSQEAEFTPDAEAQQSGLAQIINSPETGVVLVARQGDQVVGMVNLLFTVSTALGGKVALLEDMVVSPAVRAAGVGAQVLSAAVAFARTQGCKRITLLTDRDNEAGQRFYAKRGFVVSSMVPMRMVLA